MFFNTIRAVRLALKSLLLHKLRSGLTMLGIVFGVFSVIAMLAIGEGASAQAQAQVRQLGATNIIVVSVKPRRFFVELIPLVRSRSFSISLRAFASRLSTAVGNDSHNHQHNCDSRNSIRSSLSAEYDQCSRGRDDHRLQGYESSGDG